MLILLFTLVLIVLGVCTINLSSLNLTENERRLLYVSDGDEQTDNEDFSPEKAEQETDPNFEKDFNNDFGRDLGEDFDLSFSPDPTPKGKEVRQSDPRRHRHPEDLEMEEEMRRRHRHPEDLEMEEEMRRRHRHPEDFEMEEEMRRRHRHPEDLEMEEEMRSRHRHPDDFEFRDRDRRAAKSRIMKDLDEENIDLNKFNSEEEALNLTKQIYEKR